MPRARSNGPEPPFSGDEGTGDAPGRAQDITARHEPAVAMQPAAPIEEPSSVPAPSRAGLIAATIAALVLVVGTVGLTLAIIAFRDRVPVKVESVTESVDSSDGCTWQLEIELRNNSDEPVTVTRVGAIINRGTRGGDFEVGSPLAAGEIRLLNVDFRLPAVGGCPQPDEINHGNLIFHLESGDKVSIRF